MKAGQIAVVWFGAVAATWLAAFTIQARWVLAVHEIASTGWLDASRLYLLALSEPGFGGVGSLLILWAVLFAAASAPVIAITWLLLAGRRGLGRSVANLIDPEGRSGREDDQPSPSALTEATNAFHSVWTHVAAGRHYDKRMWIDLQGKLVRVGVDRPVMGTTPGSAR